MDGRVDAYLTTLNIIGEKKYSAHSSLAEPLAQKGDLFFLSATEADIARGNKSSGWAFGYVEIPAGALGPKQPDKISSYAMRLAYLCAPELPDDIAYEWMRIAHKHYKELPPHGASLEILIPDNLGWLPVKSEADIHPGALKYYKEHNLPLRIAK